MASLKEIKGRIASVSGTLKITSAMKLVASAKLRKAQQAIGYMLPYERQLHRILENMMAALTPDAQAGTTMNVMAGLTGHLQPDGPAPAGPVAIVAFASNSSLCGAFNSNAVKQTLAVIDEYRSAGLSDGDITVYSIGRKMSDAMRKAGFASPADYSRMSDSPSYDAAAALAAELVEGFESGRFAKIELVYNHFKSTASQPTVRETYLPMSSLDGPDPFRHGAPDPERHVRPDRPSPDRPYPDDIIIEPSAEEMLRVLLPKVLRLKIYTTLLDSSSAEHAARTVAMQTATDNGNDLLEELTLEYNKGRQQKITSEILDIVGGSMQ